MTTLTFTGTQSWTVPSDCRSIDWCWAIGPGFRGTVGYDGSTGPSVPGDGGYGGSSGAASYKASISVTPGESITVYVGGASSAGYSGLYSATRGWLCLAYGAGGTLSPGSGPAGVGDSKTSGNLGATGGSHTPTAGGVGGTGASPPGPYGGAGGAGGNGAVPGQTYPYYAAGTPAGNGAGGSGYGAGGGGGGGGASPINTYGGAYGEGVQGVVQLSYTPYVAHPPTVTSLSKSVGSPGGGETITITGTNFNYSASAVKFGDVNAASFTVVSATQITAVTPQHTAGVFDVRVTNVDGTSATGGNDQFTFKARNGFFKSRWGF